MNFTITLKEVFTQRCSIRGQRHSNDKLGCLLICVNYCGSNCCLRPTTMLEKERTLVSTINIFNIHIMIKYSVNIIFYAHCTWYQHSCRNLWRLQEIHISPLKGFAVVCLQMTTHRKPVHTVRHIQYYSPIMCDHALH